MPRKKKVPAVPTIMERVFPLHEKMVQTVMIPLNSIPATKQEAEMQGYSRVLNAALDTYNALSNGVKVDASTVEKADLKYAYLKLKEEIDTFREVSELAAKKLNTKDIDSLMSQVLEEVNKQEKTK